jgi:NAD-dependent DNA ligase (contains BRCT domain type II)
MQHEADIFKRMEDLSNQISKHAYLYFYKDKSIISDFAYDELTKQFKQLCKDHPKLAELFEIRNKPVPIREPGGQGLKVITFNEPMLSLDKVYTLDEIERFKAKFPKDTAFFYELKLDGLALEIEYKDWKLFRITTRGSGLSGEDVTHSLPLFDNLLMDLPPHFPPDFKVRGEAIVSYENYHIYNEAAAKPAKSPRNAVSGWVRALKKNQNKQAFGLVYFYVYWVNDSLGCKTYEDLRNQLFNAGFNAPPQASMEAIRDEVDSQDWPADGIVIKVNDLELRKATGENNQFPLWATAWKYPNKELTTPIEDVEWNTGMTGRVTPVGIYNPVHFGSVECSRASIDNYFQFMKLGLRKGSVVTVSRNGDVIPRIVEMVEEGDGEHFQAPETCPSCGSLLEVRKGKTSADLICNNVVECPEQLMRRCEEMVSKKCLDIEGLGPVKIAELIEGGHVTRTADIFKTMIPMPPKALIQLLSCQEQPAHIIIKALGLPKIDLTRAKKLASAWPRDTSLIEFLKDTDQLMAIDGISAGIAFPIAKIMKNADFVANAEAILAVLKEDSSKDKQEYWIKGCITGSLGQSRDELKEVFGEHGIELVEDLTKDCQFLIVGERPGLSKKLKATELGIAIVEGSNATSIEKLIEEIKSRVPGNVNS